MELWTIVLKPNGTAPDIVYEEITIKARCANARVAEAFGRAILEDLEFGSAMTIDAVY